jgi:NAD-dependent deacetylase
VTAAVVDALVAALVAAERELVLVVTGAGISLASGIPTFRGLDPHAVWARDVTELGTKAYFKRDPVGSWQFYLARFDAARNAKPNPGHDALVALERWQLERGGRYLLVTQNVDTLHRVAGSRELVEVHGAADRVRCSQHGCSFGAPRGSIPRAHIQAELDAFRAAPSDATVPRCAACGARLRQHVLWFDEMYTGHTDYQFERVQAAARDAAVVVFIGTSFAVGVTELVLDGAERRRRPTFSIDPGGLQPRPSVHVIAAAAEQALPRLVERLTAS